MQYPWSVTHVGPPEAPERYKVLGEKGRGSHGRVHLAENTETHHSCILKFVRKSPSGCRFLVRELRNHDLLQHPHIIRLHTSFEFNGFSVLVMEYAEGGSLQRLIDKHQSLKEECVRHYFQQIITAVKFMHDKGISHRDLKPANIVLNKERNMLKVCDFGFSKNENNDSVPNTFLGSPYHLAPELLRKRKFAGVPVIHDIDSYDAKKVDIWACGVMLFTMLFGRKPYIREGNEMYSDLFAKIMGGNVDIPDVHYDPRRGETRPISGGCQALLRGMLEPDPDARVSINRVIEDPWFRINLPQGYDAFLELQSV